MRKVLAALAIAAIIITGCGPGDYQEEIGHRIQKVEIDGTTCIVYHGAEGRGGIDCNF